MSSLIDSKRAGKSEIPKASKDNKALSGGQAPSPRSRLNDWRAKLKEKRKLTSAIPAIFDTISESCPDSKRTDETGKDANAETDLFLDDIKFFLEGKGPAQEVDEQMDDCIRWSLLVKALDRTNSEPSEEFARSAICDIVLQKWPMLATLRFQREKGKASRNESCKNQLLHKVDESKIPFHEAARSGQHSVIKRMISFAKQADIQDGRGIHSKALDNKESPIKVLQSQDPSTQKSPMLLALEAELSPMETLKELLEIPGITESCDCFNKALEVGLDRVLDTLLDNGQRMSERERKDSILKAVEVLDKSIVWEKGGRGIVRSDANDRKCRLSILEALVRHATPTSFDQEVVEKLIEKNLTEVWDARAEDVPSEEVESCLLHIAVLHEKLEFVEMFLNRYGRFLNVEKTIPGRGSQEKSKAKFPLWYNNHRWIPTKGEFEQIRKPLEPAYEAYKGQSARSKIRNLIVTKMIHDLDMNDLPDYLHRSLEPFNDLCFDISRINSSTYQVSDFVDSLIYQDEVEDRRVHRYEETLKYVEFPPLDMMEAGREPYKQNSYLRKDHEEVFRILDWLYSRGVRKIIKLKVPDRLVNPHDDVRMADYVERFEVEVLDWKVLDLSISVFKDRKHELEEIRLYSSGRRSVIDHWFNKDDGVESLPKLKKLHFRVIRVELPYFSRLVWNFNFSNQADEERLQETCTRRQAKDILGKIQKLKQDLEERKQRSLEEERKQRSLEEERKQRSLEERRRRGLDNRRQRFIAIDPSEESWYPSPAEADLTKIAYRLAPRLGQWLVQLEPFIAKRNNGGKTKHKPTRVAILDNGIFSVAPVVPGAAANREAMTDHMKSNASKTNNSREAIAVLDKMTGDVGPEGKPSGQEPSKNRRSSDEDNSLWSRIRNGRSFVEGNSKFCPWQFPSDPHGTQMANLICAIDPSCEIYVARVMEDAFGITNKAVAKAIDWAVEEKVDIISMSFILGDWNEEMKTSIDNAATAGIVMTCSTHDEGSRISKAFPAGYKDALRPENTDSLIVLAACDEYGKLLRHVEENGYSFKLRGQDVPAGIVPFVKSEETISGSSVATALAAGLCSLILTCQRLAHPGKDFSHKDRSDTVQKHLKKMQAGTGAETKYVLLDRFGKLSTPDQSVGQQNVDVRLRSDVSVDDVLRGEFGMIA